jgi:molybdate-binding protein/DNA-binding PadR family transcriptional regulator
LSIAHALLGLLARGRRCGYELRRELEEEFGAAWRLDYGQLYRALASAERRRWIEAGPPVRGGRGPARKPFTLTRAGRTELRRWLREPARPPDRGRDEFPLKLRFGLDANVGSLGELVAQRRDVLESRRTESHGTCEEARHRGDAGRWLLAETRRQQFEGAIASLEPCEAVAHRRAAKAPREERDRLVAVGSDDLLLDLLVRHLAASHPGLRFSASRVGSMGGLFALAEGRAHLAGVHLLDIESGEYNVPFVRHLLPEERVLLVNLSTRAQGLLVAPGNPKRLRRLRDLARPGVRLVNRQPGAGTRLLLYHHLRKAGIDPRSLCGYRREVPTHDAVAAAIRSGRADAGPGIRAVAEAWGLGFVPLGRERYDLAIPRRLFDSPRLRPLLEAIHDDAFRAAAGRLSGYDTARMSEIVADVH